MPSPKDTSKTLLPRRQTVHGTGDYSGKKRMETNVTDWNCAECSDPISTTGPDSDYIEHYARNPKTNEHETYRYHYTCIPDGLLVRHQEEGKQTPMFSLNTLAHNIHEANRDKGFWDHHRPLTETTMLIVTELAEAVEEERNGNPEIWYGPDGKPEGVDVELVDALIRLLDLMGARGTDVDAVMSKKLAYNAARPAKHGKAY